MIRTRGLGRLPTMAPSRMPPPQAKAMDTATSYRVTPSARPYSPASFQPAASVDDSAGRNSSGMRPRRGSASQSTMSAITISQRSVDAFMAASRRFSDVTPDAVAQRAEGVAGQHLVGARARKLHLQQIDNAARPRRHHGDLVGEIDGFREAMGDEYDGLPRRGPDAQQLV